MTHKHKFKLVKESTIIFATVRIYKCKCGKHKVTKKFPGLEEKEIDFLDENGRI